MSPRHRTLEGDILAFDLAGEMRLVRAELIEGRTRVARTLVKEGPLRVTLIGLKPGGSMAEHKADAPISIHVLEGEIVLQIGKDARFLASGVLAAVDAGVRHAVSSPRGGVFLLTLAAPLPVDQPVDQPAGPPGGSVS
jgi:quercetin dioxygenase-like cupin family protein